MWGCRQTVLLFRLAWPPQRVFGAAPPAAACPQHVQDVLAQWAALPATDSAERAELEAYRRIDVALEELSASQAEELLSTAQLGRQSWSAAHRSSPDGELDSLAPLPEPAGSPGDAEGGQGGAPDEFLATRIFHDMFTAL